jgi:ribosomal protein S18 acetylase RimI-like enzyme
MKKKFSSHPDPEIILRPLCIEDYDAVVALWRRSEGVGLNESDTRVAITAFLRRNPRLSFVAEKQGRIIGAVLCGHDGRRGYLHHLAVSKRHRQHGIGRQLVNACLTRLHKIGIQKCSIFLFASNVAGRKFWQRMGWSSRTEIQLMQIRLKVERHPKQNFPC